MLTNVSVSGPNDYNQVKIIINKIMCYCCIAPDVFMGINITSLSSTMFISLHNSYHLYVNNIQASCEIMSFI